MLRWLPFYLQMCLLKQAPQNAPYSKSLMYFGIGIYYIIGAVITSFTQDWVVAMIMSFIQIVLLIFLTNLLLWVRKTPERYEQTIAALTICGAIVGIAAIPVLGLITSMGPDSEGIGSMMWVALIIWETVIVGHIFRHSMDISLPGGLGIALVYMYMSFAITLRLMKIVAAPF